MDPKNFFAELKRRNVYKTAVAYAVVAWLLIQITTQTFPFFEIPKWAVRLVIFLFVLGFPVALIFAWIFELTPEGLKRTVEVAPGASITRRTGRKLDFIIMAVLLAVIGLLVVTWHGPRSAESDEGGLEKSIAVLPFENMSEEASNAFFAEGIQDDVLTSLARIKELKVISRSSVMSYRNRATRNLREIGRQLGVVHILEGSVRKTADRVLVNVNLVDTRDSHQIWAERYDRTLANSLTLQGELAGEIANALRATLSPDEKARLETKPTENPDAYVLYLRGRDYQLRPELSRQNYQAAEGLYRQAVALDPKFVLARARLSFIQTLLFSYFDHTAALLIEAQRNAEEALRQDPSSGEAHLALARCLSDGKKLDAVPQELAAAIRYLPNDGFVAMVAAVIQGQNGWHQEALASYERALVLSPREAKVFYNYHVLLEDMRNIDGSRKASDRALELAPDSIFFRLNRARAEVKWTGDINRCKTFLAGLPAGQDPDGRVTAAHCTVAVLERNFPEALRLLAAYPNDSIPLLGGGLDLPAPKIVVEGFIHLYAGDLAAAYRCFDQGRWVWEVDARDNPSDPDAHLRVGLIYAGMGWNAAAKAEADRASQITAALHLPAASESYLVDLASIYGRIGEADLAFPLLERALAESIGFYPNELRLHPQWDPIRKDPRFEKILSQPVVTPTRR
ncbi:MAG: eukaryotic-like serine/threonine-protein kinase [Verrucomicrobiota bacterium]|jgi:TolB-like protein